MSAADLPAWRRLTFTDEVSTEQIDQRELMIPPSGGRINFAGRGKLNCLFEVYQFGFAVK
jgi:hypothetical protein